MLAAGRGRLGRIEWQSWMQRQPAMEIGLTLTRTISMMRTGMTSRGDNLSAADKRNRCIIPASGYCEWIKKPDGKQPYFISAAGGGVLSFAGLWAGP